MRSQIPPDAVRQIRAELGLSQVAAGLLAGVTERTWRRWERGEVPPDADRIELMRLRAARTNAAPNL